MEKKIKSSLENNFFKDVEILNLDFEYKKITDWENTYLLVDNSKFNNFIINKINEFTLFIYVTVFFLFIILTFNLIKNILWK